MWSNQSRGVASAVVCLAVGVLAGCESSGRTEPSERAIESLASTRSEVNKAKNVVGETQRALDQLSAAGAGGGDVSKAYRNFTKADDNLRDSAQDARKRALEMRDNGRAYMENWEHEMDQVSSPEIRSSATQRRAAVRANYDQMAASARSARDAYQAYDKDLTDIRQALASDMSPAGVQSVQPVIRRAQQNGQVLQQRLDAFSAEIDRVYAGMGGRPASE